MNKNFPPKIRLVKALDNYVLLVTFNNGITKQYDFKSKIIEYPYTSIAKHNLFKSVQVDTGGYGLSWSDDIDISEHELWEKGVTV